MPNRRAVRAGLSARWKLRNRLDQMDASRQVQHLAFRSGELLPAEREVASEVPVAFTYRGSTQAVMMATPADLEDFAYGFTLSEGIVTRPEDILSVSVEETGGGIELQIELAGAYEEALTARRRAMAGPVGCGLCGIESIEQALLPARKVDAVLTMTAANIADAAASLGAHQPLFRATRAVHAAGFYVPGEGLTTVREDVGRHNALDKLCGALARSGMDTSRGAIVLTSRLSVELVQKTASAGIGMMIAISAPSSLAIAMAEAANITLVALARGSEFDVFTHPNRLAEWLSEGAFSDVA